MRRVIANRVTRLIRNLQGLHTELLQKKYKGQVDAVDKLSNKVLKGGTGVWGETPMSAHAQLNKDQAAKMVEYILSLADESKLKNLPLQGVAKFVPAPKKEGVPSQSVYLINASYEDAGNAGVPSLSRSATKVLRAPVLTGNDAELSGGIRKLAACPDVVLENITHNSSVTFKSVGLTGVGRLDFVIAEAQDMKKGSIEVYLGSTKGEKLGMVDFAESPKIQIVERIFMISI